MLFMAIGAYIHNDLVDVKSDFINKKNNVVGTRISTAQTRILYVAITLIPIPIVHWLSNFMGSQLYALFYYVGIALIYLYNGHLQRIAFLGNLVVSLLCSFAVGLIYIAEYEQFMTIKLQSADIYSKLNFIVLGYVAFAFVTTLIREIVKDSEDIKGDQQEGLSTLPIVAGMRWTRRVILLMEILLFIFISWWIWKVPLIPIVKLLGSIFMLVPIVYNLVITYRAVEKKDYSFISQILKIEMIMGLLFLIIVVFFK